MSADRVYWRSVEGSQVWNRIEPASRSAVVNELSRLDAGVIWYDGSGNQYKWTEGDETP